MWGQLQRRWKVSTVNRRKYRTYKDFHGIHLKQTKNHAKNDHLEHQTTKAKTLALAQIASKYGKY